MAVLQIRSLILIATTSLVCLRFSECCFPPRPCPCPGKPSSTQLTNIGEPCIFPFKEGSTEYFKCVESDEISYCATSLNRDCTYKTLGICDRSDDSACSLPTTRNNTRMTGGEAVSSMTKFPWQVGIVDKDSNPPKPFCGGSIIGNNWILSAAHCTERDPIQNAEDIQVLMGEKNWNTETNPYAKMQILDIQEKIPHADYTQLIDDSEYDILLLKTADRIKFSDRVQKISLTPSGYTPSTKICLTFSGWGYKNQYDEEQEIGLPKILRYVRVRAISNEDCYKIYEESPDETEMCTTAPSGSKGDVGGSCAADSGGPLFETQSRRLIGVVSRGKKHCQVVSVFTRVESYLGWIKKHTGITP